jgi:hypothetical protein
MSHQSNQAGNRCLLCLVLPGSPDTLWAHELGAKIACTRHKANMGAAKEAHALLTHK